MNKRNKYRIRDGPCTRKPEDPYEPIQITVKPLFTSGMSYIFCTENDTETFQDVKMALLEKIGRGRGLPVFQQLAFFKEFVDDEVDDHVSVLSLIPQGEPRVITLELGIKEREYTLEEQGIYSYCITESEFSIDPHRTPTIYTIPGMVYVAIEAIEKNQNIIELHVEGDGVIPIMEIMRALRGKTTIKLVKITHGGLTSEEMAELFSIISENNIKNLWITNTTQDHSDGNFQRSTYRMKDLVELLTRSTSIKEVYIKDANIEIAEEDFPNLVGVLSYKNNINLSLRKNLIFGNINEEFLQSISDPGNRDPSFTYLKEGNNISLSYYK